MKKNESEAMTDKQSRKVDFMASRGWEFVIVENGVAELENRRVSGCPVNYIGIDVDGNEVEIEGT